LGCTSAGETPAPQDAKLRQRGLRLRKLGKIRKIAGLTGLFLSARLWFECGIVWNRAQVPEIIRVRHANLAHALWKGLAMERFISTQRRIWILGAALGLWLFGAGPICADSIDDLRQALALDDVNNPTDAVLKFRKENLGKKIAALNTIGEMRRALALNEWRDGPDYLRFANNSIRQIDADMRTQLGNRLTKTLNNHAQSSDPAIRAAVASLLAEMGASVRGLNPNEKGGFAAAQLD